MHPARWLAAMFLLAAPVAVADETAAADFTPALEQLVALDLPALPENVEWATISEARGSDSVVAALTGKAWLFPATEGGPRRAIAFGESDSEDLPDPDGKPKSSGLFGGGKKQAVSKPADLTKDVESVRKALKKLKPFRDPDDFTQSYNSNGAVAFGPLLLFAAQLHQTGRDELANSLADALFTAAPSREAVVDAAVNALAQPRYDAAARAFFEDQDWEKFHREAAALVEKYPRGWRARLAVAMLVPQLAVRAAGTEPPVPANVEPQALEAVSWMLKKPSPDDPKPEIPKEVAAELAEIPAQYHAEYLRQMGIGRPGAISVSGNWLLAEPADLAKSAGIALPALKLGIRALPVLAALADDAYLTYFPNSDLTGGSSSYSSNRSELEEAMEIYKSMARPASRGDIARFLLAAVLPDADGELRNSDGPGLRDAALDFWQRHKDDDRDRLAIACLQEGGESQRGEAVALLAKSGSADGREAVEKFLLEAPSPLAVFPLATVYVQSRKAAAKPFVDQFSKAVREETASGLDLENNYDIPYQFRKKGAIATALKQLNAMVSGQSPQARAREIARGEPKEAETAIPALLGSLSSEPSRRRFLAMLAGAQAAEDVGVRALFIQATMQGSGRDSTVETRKIPAAEAKVWKILMADDRAIPPSSARNDQRLGEKINEVAAVALEFSANPKEVNDFPSASVITGKSYAELAVPRANARLVGEAIPPLPDPIKVTPARLAEIVAEAGKREPLKIHPYLKTLTDDERAAWLQWVREPGDLKIPENVSKLQNVVVSRLPTFMSLSDQPGTLSIEVGQTLNRQLLETQLAKWAADPAANTRSTVYLQSAPFPPGLAVAGIRPDLPAKRAEGADDDMDDRDPFAEPEDADSQAYLSEILGELNGEAVPENAIAAARIKIAVRGAGSPAQTWWIIDGKPVPKSAKADSPDVLSTLEKAVAEHTPFYLQLQFLTKSDAAALAPAHD